jgi:ubiquinone/menaquinone biosynthesis C-methylase UbiE
MRQGAALRMRGAEKEAAVKSDVEQHYGRSRILDAILAALREAGKDVARLKPEDLAPVDEFHIRGREATIELARRASLEPGTRVLDVGCGLGGSARYLAAEHGCRVTGIDLTQEYVDVANALAARVGLSDRVAFKQASALKLPFDDGCFDVVWTQHVQMNIADKGAFYGEIARVTRPNGLLLFHDIFAGDGGPLHYPVPWAETPSISFLAPPGQVRERLEELGFAIRDWVNTTDASLQWLVATIERLGGSGLPTLGTHLLMGDTAKQKIANVLRNLREGRVVVYQACAELR